MEDKAYGLLEIQVTKVICDFLKFKLQRQDVSFKPFKWEFQILTEIQELSNFHTTNSPFIRYNEKTFKFRIHYICGQFTKQVTNLKYKLQMFCLQRNK